MRTIAGRQSRIVLRCRNVTTAANTGYRLVRLANGAVSVHALAFGETFHPAIGPVAEAEALYVRQLNLPVRARTHAGAFVVWDVGLGAAANALTVLRATRDCACPFRILSFDNTVEPLRFGLEQAEALGYFASYEEVVRSLLARQQVRFADGARTVDWTLHLADFPRLLEQAAARELAAPHAILFDAFSPATNPAMWTQPLFARLYRLLDPQRPSALATYSRSTMLRVSLLLAGFFVGAGHATGEKEETTLAANTPTLLAEPLDRRWLQRARRSTSAEPMWEPVYRQARLSSSSWERLLEHPQFA
jgi:tRNA U34 5-methylaminomethyl-2-thiouridine-forming methyltransferase MnmC